MLNKSSQLLLILWNILHEMESQKPPQGFKYASYEVTIPRKVKPRSGQQETLEVTYHLQIEGRGHMVHLSQKKSFAPKNIPVLTYSKQGELQVDYPFIRNNCFYQGYIEGKLSSLAVISTCSGGLRGLLQLENKTYEIEPIQASPNFQHVVYRLEEKEGDEKMKCGVTKEDQNYQESMMPSTENELTKSNSRSDWWSHTRYVKVAIVVEHERYLKFGKNETFIGIQVLNIVHIANSFYEPLSVQISVAGLEIWSEKNLIHIAHSALQTFNSFVRWRRRSLSKRLENDAAHLFVYKYFGKTLGLAPVGTICDDIGASAVESYVEYSLLYFSVIFAHELGHILGMRHDGIYCRCNRRSCIMDEYHTSSDMFSNCSYKEYFNLRNADCLLIPPDHDKVYKVKYCGNKVVEKGEQCDCGSKADCESDQCCKSNCRLRSGAICAFGQCCVKCQYLPAQSICRDNTSICDLPEYCNGTSEWCPKDVYVQDGAPCDEDAYCYHGNCSTHVRQCKMIFGKKATAASKSCFRHLNAEGDRFGNCGLNHGTYTKCRAENILCGRIQCENIDILPSLEEHSTIIQSSIGDKECWSTDYHGGMRIADIGAVRDGTPCGTDRMCIDGQCLDVSLLKYDCNITKCHNRGICNTQKHCHCDYGWDPPDCVIRGYGGSLDSGPPPPWNHDLKNTRKHNLFKSFFFISPVVVVVGLGVFFRAKLIYQCSTLREWVHPAVKSKWNSTENHQI
ncbi:disintegrin and metalloproteinase domain-containing protein 20-like [Anolis sagrei]|uniref:disintegrin and metalloproteinase domain-containing protein 20-like n=1 Tax=Anolis sagrei TaxID=38937 RepID=UPI0035230EAC